MSAHPRRAVTACGSLSARFGSRLVRHCEYLKDSNGSKAELEPPRSPGPYADGLGAEVQEQSFCAIYNCKHE